jgi:pilus assembly protein Flp/PilA
MKTIATRFIYETEGQDLIEYALLAAGIALAAVTAINSVGTALSTKFNAISTQLTSGS